MKARPLATMFFYAALLSCTEGNGVGESSVKEEGTEVSASLTDPESIVFDSQSWDFGHMSDEAGSVSHVYAFLNTSGGEVRIGSVEISCSCLTAEYTDEPVPAGGRGEVILTFMPAGAAGTVYRTAEVFAVDGSHIATLSMLADVDRVGADLEDLYHYTLSEKLLVDRGEVPFGYVHHGRSISKIVRLANVSHEAIALRMVTKDSGSMLSIEYPEQIGPRSEAEILLTYRVPDDDSLYGVAEDEVLVFADEVQTYAPLKASAIYLSAPAGGRPTLWITPSLVKMEKTGRRFKGAFELGNTGETDLHILAIDSPVPLPISAGTTLRPGEKLQLKVWTREKPFTARLFTDDPLRPYKELIFN